jgi:hypothetical protein
MAHFTYDPPDSTQLKQGDILKRTPEIEALLKDIHPHYLKNDYKYFIVLTQSCDLVLRQNDGRKARYITIAVVRPLVTLIERIIAKYQGSDVEKKGRLCDQTVQNKVTGSVEKLLNNNDTEYFYIHGDTSCGLSSSYVGFLRLSIPILSDQHYEKCLQAKFAELNAEFRAKLGWLVGNIYSRVGTTDWVPDKIEPDAFKGMITQVLNQNVYWVDKKKLKELNKTVGPSKVGELSEAAIRDLVSKIKMPTKREKFVVKIEELIRKRESQIDPKICRDLIDDICTDPAIESLTK